MTPNYDELNSEIGELYPILLDAKGNLIDGFHRRSHKKSWHTIKLAQIKTKADLLTARIIANCQRLDHSEESKKWVNELAEELNEHSEVPMAKRIADKTGMGESWVRIRLAPKFKDLKHARPKNPNTETATRVSRPSISFPESDMPVEPPRIIREDAKGDWVLKQWNWVLEKIPETNAINDLLPPQRKQVLRQLKDLQVKITAWIQAVEEVQA